jgi:hypothetical protein
MGPAAAVILYVPIPAIRLPTPNILSTCPPTAIFKPIHALILPPSTNANGIKFMDDAKFILDPMVLTITRDCLITINGGKGIL